MSVRDVGETYEPPTAHTSLSPDPPTPERVASVDATVGVATSADVHDANDGKGIAKTTVAVAATARMALFTVTPNLNIGARAYRIPIMRRGFSPPTEMFLASRSQMLCGFSYATGRNERNHCRSRRITYRRSSSADR